MKDIFSGHGWDDEGEQVNEWQDGLKRRDWGARWTDRSDGVRHQVTTGVRKTNGCGGKHLDRIG